MKTTVDIPEELILEVQKVSGSRSKKEAIITALEDYLQRSRMKELVSLLGTCDDFAAPEEMRQMRAARS